MNKWMQKEKSNSQPAATLTSKWIESKETTKNNATYFNN